MEVVAALIYNTVLQHFSAKAEHKLASPDFNKGTDTSRDRGFWAEDRIRGSLEFIR